MNDGAGWQGGGQVGGALASVRFDTGFLRPFTESNPQHPLYGKKCIIFNTGRSKFIKDPRAPGGWKMVPEQKQATIQYIRNTLGIDSPVFNATALRKEEWIQLDTQVL